MHGRDVSGAGVIVDLAKTLGISDAAITRRLRENADRDTAHGAFGVRTFVIDGDTFWGHDVLEMILDYLRGPSRFQDPEMQTIERLPIGVIRPRRG